jgi:REP element-mobilizing transposase RayT
MHLVLRSSLAKGAKSFLKAKYSARIRAIIRKQAQINGVKLYGVANRGDHFHLLVLPRSRKSYLNFVRAITGLIARVVTGAQRGKAEASSKNQQQALSKAADTGQRTAASKSFWDQRPFSRIVDWGRNFTATKKYLLQNALEAIGFTPMSLRIIAKNTS